MDRTHHAVPTTSPTPLPAHLRRGRPPGLVPVGTPAPGLAVTARPSWRARLGAHLAATVRSPSPWCLFGLIWAVAAVGDSATTWVGLRLGGVEGNVVAAWIMATVGVEATLIGGALLSLLCGLACCVPRGHRFGPLRGGLALAGSFKFVVLFSNLAVIADLTAGT